MDQPRNSIRWDQDSEGIVTLTLDDPDHAANLMNALYVASMAATVERLQTEKPTLKGVIVTSAKKTFFAGGDLTALSRAQPEDADEVYREVRRLTAQLRALETLGVPVVAALNGSALGGGLEIALACHHRIAIDEPRSEYGFPEVTLGLLPAGNGVVRSVRLLGIASALKDVLLQGQRMKARRAQEVGLIDVLVADHAALLEAARAFVLDNPGAQQPWDAPAYEMPGGTPASPKLAMQLPTYPANLKRQLRGADFPAPRLIMAAAVEGAQVDFDSASRIEARYFVELVTGQISKNLIKTFFFDLHKINGGASRPKDYPAWTPTRVGILGAGMMGSGIAYVTARAGIPCVLKDVSLANANKGRAHAERLVARSVARGKLSSEAAAELLGGITPTASAEDLEGCDMLIEAVFEDRQLKATVTQEAESFADAGALVCSNTSTLPIGGLAMAAKVPDNFIGLHFFSPVDRMPLVEIIAGEQTSDATLARAFDFVRTIGKTPIVVNDSRGFFTTRVFSCFTAEGMSMLAEGYNPSSIEQAALQNGAPVGPLAVSDEVSLELIRRIGEQTEKDFAAEGKTYVKTPAERLVERMCLEFDRKGKAAGAGFYEYPQDGRKSLWPGLKLHFGDPARERPSEAEFAELQDRLLYHSAVETVRCLAEGVLRSVADANVGSIMGIGAPAWTGGFLQFVNHVGLRAFVERANELAAKHGERFAPPKLLLEMAERGDTFE